MNYKEIKAEENLSNFVKCFWTSETTTEIAEHTILPDGFFDLIVIVNNGKLSTIKITGIWTIPVDIKIERNTKVFAVRFKPLATELLEYVNLKSIMNSYIILDPTFLGLDALSYDRFQDFCQHIESYLKGRLDKIKKVSDLKIGLFKEIYEKNTVNVQELSQKAFWTCRQINRYFNLNFGLSLKEYLNIIRCKEAYLNISKNKFTSQSKYFDQSHYIKEVKKYTGVTPKELSRNKNDRFLQLLNL